MITLFIRIAVLGFLAYLVDTYIPMPEPFKTVCRVVAFVILVVLLLSFFGIFIAI